MSEAILVPTSVKPLYIRSIGEIIYSTIPLVDAGLHLLDGSLISSGEYQQFVNYMATLYDSGDYDDVFVTQSAWDTAVATYGVCGKFVYNSTNNTVRLPKYSNKIYTKELSSTAPVVGNGMTLGLTDGTQLGGMANISTVGLVPRDDCYGTNVGSSASGSGNTGVTFGITTDATNSGIIAQLSNITSSVDGYYYIVIANVTNTKVENNINRVSVDVQRKADLDLVNSRPTHIFATYLDNANIRTIIETYTNGLNGYNIWSNGYYEQWGHTTEATPLVITFAKEFADTNYNIMLTADSTLNSNAGDSAECFLVVRGEKATNKMKIISVGRNFASSYNARCYWRVSGYLAEGEY